MVRNHLGSHAQNQPSARVAIFTIWLARHLEVDAVAEVFVEFAEPVAATDGEEYIARACGGEDERGHWQGWLEFTPTSGGATVRPRRLTGQACKSCPLLAAGRDADGTIRGRPAPSRQSGT